MKSFFQHDYYDKETGDESKKFQEDDEDSLTENPFLEDDSEHYSDRQNSQQDEEESLVLSPDSSGAKESLNKARPLGSKNAKSVTEKASIE